MMKRISRISLGLAAALIMLMIGLCFTASAQLQPVDVTGPTYDTPNQAFTKLNANDVYLEGLIPLTSSYWKVAGTSTLTADTKIASSTYEVAIGQNITTSGITGQYNFMFGTDHSLSGTSGALTRWATIFGEAGSIVNNGTSGKRLHNAFILGGYLNSITNTGAGEIFSPFIIGTRNTITNTTEANSVGSMVIGYRSSNDGSMNLVTGFRGHATSSAVGGFVHGFSTTYTSSGSWSGTVEPVTIGGRHAVNISANSESQTVGHGAYGDYSAILGGIDADIPSTSPRSVVIGGNGIKARASDPDEVYVPSLNLADVPINDDTLTQILARDFTTGKVKYRDVSTISGGGGITNGAAVNELMKSDGTNAVGSIVYQLSTGSGAAIGINNTAPDAKLDVNSTTAFTSSVAKGLRLSIESTGTPAIGIGVGMEFETETSASNNEVTGAIESVVTNTASTNEYADLVLKNFSQGAQLEALRLVATTGTSRLSTTYANGFEIIGATKISGNTTINNSMKVGIVGDATIDRRLHVEENSSSDNTVLYPLRLTRITNASGSGNTGAGAGIEFEIENASGTNVVGSTIESVATNATGGSESFDFVVKNMSAGAAAAEKLRVTSDGRLYGTALHNNAGSVTGATNQYIASGTYSPTIVLDANLDSSTGSNFNWTRVGNVVNVSGMMAADPTSASTVTSLRIPLPVASNFTASENCGGSASYILTAGGTAINSAIIRADGANDQAFLQFYPSSTSQVTLTFTFQYLIQ